MKIFLCCLVAFTCFRSVAQLHSSIPVVHSKAQPVPNSSTSEKSAQPQPINIPPAANPVAPVYPGAEVKVITIPDQIIKPATTPSGTQPTQKEPLSPVESTNILQPNRPQREEASRKNQPPAAPVNISLRVKQKSYNINNSSSKKTITNLSTTKYPPLKAASVKQINNKKRTPNKKPR